MSLIPNEFILILLIFHIKYATSYGFPSCILSNRVTINWEVERILLHYGLFSLVC